MIVYLTFYTETKLGLNYTQSLQITMNWDLNDLYKSIDDLNVKKDKDLVVRQTEAFIKKYKGKIVSKKATGKLVHDALKEYEQLLERLSWLVYYASLLHSKDTKSTKIGKFYQEIEEFHANTISDLVWFKLELTRSEISIKEYSYFLEKTKREKPFLLSEKEEFILTKKTQTSSDAFKRFFEEKQSQLTFEIEIDKKVKTINSSELGTIIKSHPDRELRQKATVIAAEKYKDNSHFFTFALNTLLLDKQITDDLRKHKFPQEATYLNYDVDKKIVGVMTDAVVNNYPLAERYYRKKAKILKLMRLHEWDRYSYVKQSRSKYSWSEAKKIVLNSFYGFDKQFGKIAKEFFENDWIDARTAKNRRGGAYCSYLTPSKHPYIFMNFTGGLDDIMTLAHELGHGIHAYLSRGNSMLHFSPSTVTAEIASTFAESLVFDELYKNSDSSDFKINLLAEKIQRSFATVFRQTAFHLFESDIHDHRRINGELSTEEFGKYYQNRLQTSFGKGLDLTKNHEYFWMPVLHFYHFNFYVFSYAFGELMAMSLFDLYKREKKNFVKKYIDILKMGGSASPKDILKAVGQDISEENFWQSGLDLLENYIEEFEKIPLK